MRDDQFILEEAAAILGRTPASLAALLAGLPARWVRATAGDDGWSPLTVVGHLIEGERANWIPRARHILSGAQGPFEPFDRMGQDAQRQGSSIDDLLATFGELRRENLAALAGMNLTPADLERTGRHPEFGEVRLGQLLATWVVHDLNHLRQVVQTMAKVYAEAIGPWVAYLPIAHD